MAETSREIEAIEYFLKPGYLLANREDTIVRTVLGNSVAVTLFDRHLRFGGMSHFVFPFTHERARATPQFGNIAITALFKILLHLGSRLSSLEAQILGGAFRPGYEDENLGKQNIEVARKTLMRYGIPIVSEDVGGMRGRKVVYHTGTNETLVLKVDRIREADWFVPGQDLRFAASRS